MLHRRHWNKYVTSHEEIDIINDVVHYKSAYYGTIMVGNPPRSKILRS